MPDRIPPARWRRSIGLPITLSSVLISLNVVLMICWIVLLARLNEWTPLVLGVILFVLVLAGSGIYLFITIKDIQVSRRQANFVDSVTHELKSPISSLKLYLETLQLRPVEEPARQRFYEYMMDDLGRLDQLIDQLLQVSRLDAMVADSEVKPLPLEAILRSAATSAATMAHQTEDLIIWKLQPGLLVHGAKLALEIVFRNLIENAFKYSKQPPVIEIESQHRGGRLVLITISDNGPGVPFEIRKKVFQLFYRGGDELVRTKKGTGLGLYIVQTLVKKLHGRILVRNRYVGSGAVFEVWLPGKLK